MMNRGVMNRQMFQYGGGVQPMQYGGGVQPMQYGGGGGVAPMQYGGGGPVYMQQGGNPALQAAITAFFDKYGRPPSPEEIDQINAAQQMMMREGVTGPNTVSPAGPRGQSDFVPMPPSMLGPMTTGEEEGAGMLGGFPPPPSQELAPPVQMSPEYFRDMQRAPGQNTFPPRGDMEMDPRNMVPRYRNGGVVIRRQDGGPGMVMPQDMASMAQEMPAAAAALPPSEQGVVMEAMAASGTPEMGAMIEQGAQGFGDPETAENYGEMMNMTRGDQAPVEARREELAQLVGPEDAAQTPESVLALLQPVMMMASAPEPTAPGGMPVDGGIGPLAAEQMTTPVQGDMSGGVMSLANEPQPQMQGIV
jgi:hypothetical protein